VESDAWTNSAYRFAERTGEFDPKKLFAHPGPLKNFDGGGPRKLVCIVGGGIAGLTAAFELASLGHHVTILEASPRWGGRIFTHYFADGTYGELGAMRIPFDHLCVDHYIQEFSLARRDFVSSNNMGWYLLRGVKKRRYEWKEIAAQYVLPADYQRQPEEVLAEIGNLFFLTPAATWQQYSNRITNNLLRHAEDLSLGQVIRGASPLCPGLPDEAWEYVGRATNNLWLERCSMLHWLREGKTLSGGAGKYELIGGMSKLVETFRQRLETGNPQASLHSNARVLRLAILDDNQVEVVWWEATQELRKREIFDHVICTVPAFATVQIDFSPPLAARKYEALTNISYFGAGKTLMRCRERHWEIEDEIYGGSSITDLPNQQCWYPSDNSIANTETELDHLAPSLVRSLWSGVLPEERFVITDWKARDAGLSHTPGVFLAAYVWGTNARRFASLNDKERDGLMIQSVGHLHNSNERLLEGTKHWCWDAQGGGGAFACFAPGEQRRYQSALCEPILGQHDKPMILFAGEHIGVIQGWIQSAMQTALLAAIQVIES
jgi:monoamine oxidase